MCWLCGRYRLYLRTEDRVRIVTGKKAVIAFYYVTFPGLLAVLIVQALDFLDLALAERHGEIIILVLLANAGYWVLCRLNSRKNEGARERDG